MAASSRRIAAPSQSAFQSAVIAACGLRFEQIFRRGEPKGWRRRALTSFRRLQKEERQTRDVIAKIKLTPGKARTHVARRHVDEELRGGISPSLLSLALATRHSSNAELREFKMDGAHGVTDAPFFRTFWGFVVYFFEVLKVEVTVAPGPFDHLRDTPNFAWDPFVLTTAELAALAVCIDPIGCAPTKADAKTYVTPERYVDRRIAKRIAQARASIGDYRTAEQWKPHVARRAGTPLLPFDPGAY